MESTFERIPLLKGEVAAKRRVRGEDPDASSLTRFHYFVLRTLSLRERNPPT